MSEPAGDRPSEGQLYREAAEWFARMRGPDADAHRPDFEAWLARGALHRSAYNRAAEVFAMGKFFANEAGPSTARTLYHPRARAGLMFLTVALTAAGALGWITLHQANVIGILQRSEPETPSNPSELVAPTTQIRTAMLGDGSIVRLQGGARLAIAFDSTLRTLTLQNGAARFVVRHESRPFIVYAGGGSVTAHGTMFDVAMSSDRKVSVRLIEGSVEVKLPRRARDGSGGTWVRQLRSGESLSFAAEANPHSASEVQLHPAANQAPVPSSAPFGPVDSARDYDDARLADIILDANAHAVRPIRLADKALGEERVSGHFKIDDANILAKRIAALFDLAIDDRDSRTILLKRA